MNTSQDLASKQTQEHIANVALFIDTIINELVSRKVLHDKTKLEDPEISYFIEWTPKLRASTYNSDEYKDFLKHLKPALDHHYKHNRHHPEHFDNGIEGMNLVDLVEMFCDWKAATLRHADGSLQRSIEVNKERFNISPQLESIFKNTIDILTPEDFLLPNIKKPPIQVFHKNLKRLSETSYYKSVCPVCENGLLLVGRDLNTLILQEYDFCVSCGQHFQYMDIKKMQEKEQKG